MTDPLRLDRPSSPGDVPDRERDARIEELLLTGLDHYFFGQYDLAINIWTRVLFLDRGHARARAYIERARGAISERQREGDELLHTGAAALMRGDRKAARQLLTSAVDRGSNNEEALALLHRLDRLDVASSPIDRPAVVNQSPAETAPAAQVLDVAREKRLAWLAVGVLAGILLAAVAAGYLWIVTDPFGLSAPRAALPPVLEEDLPVPTSAEVTLLRARDLIAKGRPHDALALLDAAPETDRHRASLDALRATIQRQLLDAARNPITAQDPATTPR